MQRRLTFAAASLLAFALVLSGTPVLAAPRVLTFDEAVQIALDQNLSLLLADNQRDLDAAAVTAARGRFLPDLRLNLSASESFDKVDDGAGGRDWVSGRSASAGLSSSVTLFDGLGNVADLRTAKFEQVAGELSYLRARQTVVFQVISDYLALIEATEQESVRRENLAAEEEQIERVRALVEEGERPINELFQQEANVAAARVALVEARRNLELSRVDLVQTLHLDPLAEIHFAIPPPAALGAPATPDAGHDRSFPALAGTARSERADLAAVEARLDASSARLDAARATRWPTLSLSAGLSGRYADDLHGGLFDQLNDRQSAGVTLGLSFPIFDGLQRRSTIRRAAISRENAEIALEGLRQDVSLQVRRAVLDRDAARESLEAATARVAAAREAYTYTNERYLAGASTLFEVSLARRDLVSAESGEVSAHYTLLWQNRLIDYYVGTLDPDAGLGH
ncbi:MAG: TolC family protein [Candidatus Krumholzibacteriia bacterium]